MPTIAPVSDLRNYGNVLDKVTVGSPVYLTRNGHGAYSIRDMKDEENFQKAEAMCDMDAVWDGVYEASKEYDIPDRYVEEFADAIAEKRYFPLSGIPLQYRGLFTGFYSVNYKKYKAFYRVRDGYMEVIRVIMAKHDYMTILFGEPEEMLDDET